MERKSERILPGEINTDLSSLHLGNDKARFIRNWDYVQFAGEKEGENAMVYKPLQSNELYDKNFVPPAGRNFPAGKYVSKETAEVYVWVWNSLNNHFLYRLKNGKCQMVFIGPELGIVLDPAFFVAVGRATVIRVFKGNTGYTYILYLDGGGKQRFICVEDSIATNFFSETTYPRFKSKFPREELLNLGIRTHNDCIQIKEVKALTPTKINKLKYHPWQFRLLYIDVYGRPSEHGIISDQFWQSDCVGDGLSCLDLTFDAGGPMVEKIKVEYRKSCIGEWASAETLEKYEAGSAQWYIRKINKRLQLDTTSNLITYRFCADKECLPVPDIETQRAQNPLPIISESLFTLDGGIGLGGNEHGRKPFSEDVMSKVKFEVEAPKDIDPIVVANRTIVVWVQIYNPLIFESQAIWRQAERNVFGGLGSNGRKEKGVSGQYKQYFGTAETEGFIGYLAGTGYTAVSEQWKLGSDARAFPPPSPIAQSGKVVRPNQDWIYHGLSRDIQEVRNNYWLQRIEFKNVPPGKYVFRLAGHGAALADTGFRETSTYYAGHCGLNGKVVLEDKLGLARELHIDVCQKDWDGMKENTIVQVWDLTRPVSDINLKSQSRASSGYVYETNDRDKGKLPIIHAATHTNAISIPQVQAYFLPHTDYNGFFFGVTSGGDHIFWADIHRKCTTERVELIKWTDGAGLKTTVFFATSKWADFTKEECNRIRVRGRVVDCATGTGLSGVTVGLTEAQFVTTNTNGDFEIITYDWKLYANPFWQETEGNRPKNKLLVYLSGKCRMLACDGTACIPEQQIIIPGCVNCNERIVVPKETKLKIIGSKVFGPQLGGKYGFGLKGADWMDRKNFIQSREEWFLDIPTANEIGGFAYPRIKWTIDPSAIFDPWIDKLIFNWTRNLKYSDFHSHVVDRLQFIDNTGNENNVSPTQIRIYYASLHEYNKQHNFSTNTTWQIIESKENQPVVRATDTVQFIGNGDGVLFPEVITELLRFDKDGSYFHIDYNAKLKGLKEGALFKFMRENDCKNSGEYYELCDTVQIKNGKATKTTGYLNAFDSYFVTRQIPVPVVTKIKVKKAVDGSNPITYTEVEESQTTNTIKDYGWPFEHHSPSDFWGDHCGNRGRVGVKNDYEDVLFKRSEIALSGALGINSSVNYLHYFDNKRMKEFDSEIGIIVCVLPHKKRLLIITDIDSYVVAFDDNSVRMDDKRAIVVSAEKQFGNLEKPNTENFGCLRVDRNSISFYMGTACWIDSMNNGLIYHSYSAAKDVSAGNFESFLRPKIKHVKNTKGKFWHSHINPKDMQCYFTDFDIDKPDYVNNTLFEQEKINETFAIDLKSQSLRKFVSFTPEMFASFTGEETDKQFFSFKDGLPYAHYRQKPTSFNKFFGIQCQRPMRISCALDQMAVKDWVSVEVFTDNVLLWSPEVVTEFKQKSLLPRNKFKRGKKHWVGAFLCATNTVADRNKAKQTGPNALFDGDQLQGRYVDMLFVGDPDNLDKYSELTGFIINMNV